MIVEYQALNNSGAIVQDNLEVDDINQVVPELVRRGLTPVHIGKSAATSAAHHTSGTIRQAIQGILNSSHSSTSGASPCKASRKMLPFFTTQLAILLDTGTQLADSLKAIERQMTCPHWQLLTKNLHAHVEKGGTLSSALEMYPKMFDHVYVSMICAGEQSGKLSEILNRLSTISQQSERLRNKVVSAMIYPCLLTCIAIGAIITMIFFVLPRFESVFSDMNVELPSSTKTLMDISHFARDHFFVFTGAIIAVIASVVFLIRSNAGKHFIAKYSLKIPGVGKLISSLIIARMLRLTGLMVDANVSLLEAIDLTRKATKNYLYKDLMTKIYDNVMNGRTMYEAMLESDLIPASVSQMIRTGEENSQIAKVMTMLADYFDDKNETQVATLASIMEPMILIVMGSVIGTIAISLVLPMFDISRISG